MKRLFLMTCAAFICNFMNAQILVNQVATATYDYNSLYQSSDLHFYLYGDGYHNFDADNEHEFGANANGNTVIAYHSEPYDIDQIDQLVLNTVTDGTAMPLIPSYSLPNKVALQRSWSLVNGEENFFILMFENNESIDLISGCVEFHFTANDTYVTGASILDDYNNEWVDPNQELKTSDQQGYTHKYVWTFEDLDKDEQRFIYIPANCLANIFDIVNTRAVMKVNNCEMPISGDPHGDGSDPGINDSPYYTLRSQVRNFPHDPNAMVTDPNCLSPINTLHTIRYKIYFQNDGKDPVQNVFLNFFVNTPFNSIELIESSHPCEMEWQPMASGFDYSDPVSFTFQNIFLDGTGGPPPIEYDKTYGWVTFDICFNLKVFSYLGIECADSFVKIFFDREPPVIAENQICRNCGEGQGPPQDDDIIINYFNYECPDLLPPTQASIGVGNKLTDVESIVQVTKNDIQVYPNPTNDMLFFNVQDFEKSDIVKIINTTGEVIQQHFVKDIDQSLNLASIPAGVYYISVQNEVSIKTKAFVKL